VSEAKLYVLLLHMRHIKTNEHRYVMSAEVAAGEEEALIKASLLAHPGQGSFDNWTVLSRHVEEIDRAVLERAAREVLGWGEPEDQ
jgi:hypothetical protein